MLAERGLLYPDQESLACCAGLLAIAPFVARTQEILHATVMTAHLPVLMTWVAVLLLIRVPGEPSPALRLRRLVVAALFVTLAGAISEYTIPTALAGVGVMLQCGGQTEVERRRSVVLSLALLILVALVYLALRSVADGGMRPDVRPLWAYDLRAIGRSCVSYAAGVWYLAMGGFLHRVGEIGTVGVSTRLAFGAAVLGGAVQWILYRVRPAEGPLSPSRLAGGIIILIVATAPFLAMNRVIGDQRLAGRMALTVLPVASCLTIGLLAAALRPNWRMLIPLLIGAGAAFHTVDFIGWGVRERAAARVLAVEIRPLVAQDGYTVAFVERASANSLTTHSAYELTARLTGGWSSAERARFVAFSTVVEGDALSNYVRGIDLQHRRLHPDATVNYQVREVRRRGAIRRVLWIDVDRSGAHRVTATHPTARSPAGR